jgi:hypothetical protein
MYDETREGNWLTAYFADIGGWGWAMYVGFFLSAIGLVTTVAGWVGQVPAPLWIGGVVVTALLAPVFAYRKMHQRLIESRKELRAARVALEDSEKRLEQAIRDERDKSRERFDAMESRHKRDLGTLEKDNLSLQAEVARLRDSHNFRSALSVALRSEFHNEGDNAQFRLEVTNSHPFRAIENVRVRVLSLECIDGSDKKPRLPVTKPLLALTGSGRPPSSPFRIEDIVPGRGSVLFDFVLVHSGRRANHSLNYGECRSWQPQPQHLHGQKWELVHDGVLGAGMYRVEIEVQGKDVEPLTRAFEFWGDRRGPRCVTADDPAVDAAHPLDFAPTELETGPPKMHPHQLEALKNELKKAEYDKMLPLAVLWKINDTPGLCGLSGLRFVTADKLKEIPEDRKDRAVVVTDEYMAGFPTGIPGFPNAIHLADFNIAWKAARG